MLDVVCFGEILWDVFEASPRGEEPIAKLFRRELGGAPANVATGLARLGVKVAVVGGVGRDLFGDALTERLQAEGVDVRFVRHLPQRTGMTFVVRDAKGEPTFIFYRHESADLSLRVEHIHPAMGRAHWALLGTSTLMTPALARATYRFVEMAERGGAALFVDLNVRPHLWAKPEVMRKAIHRLARRAVLIKASDADLLAAGARPPFDRWLRATAPKATWLVTRGGSPATAIGAHFEVEVPAVRSNAVDATGAGDAFIAGTLATLLSAGAVPGTPAWLDRQVWRAALRVGHMMGKKAISRPGAVAGLVRLDRVRRAIDAARPRSAS